MRVGILAAGFQDWAGGVDFLRMVISSLHHANVGCEFHLLVPSKGPRLALWRVARGAYRATTAAIGRPVPTTTGTARGYVNDLCTNAESTITIHEIDIGISSIAKAARTLALDALLPSIKSLPTDFPTPWVGYIFDFQHRYLAQLFTPEEAFRRNFLLAKMLRNARSVIVNSRSVASDIAKFHEDARARVFVLPFSAAPQAAWLRPTAPIASRYGIPQRYFIVCNQFWKHKDHGAAFVAFARIAALHPDIDMVCTGATEDYRDPHYVPALRAMLVRQGIDRRVHVLGMVPKSDQIGLLKESIALVQPTLFEGGPGGGAVYDAVALGVPCLVSDIAVNRELNEPMVSFFPAGDAVALAGLMSDAIRRPTLRDSDPKLLWVSGSSRRSMCGNQILAAIDYAAGQR